MANEVEVHELQGLRGGVPVAPFPARAKQTLTIGGAVSAAFSASTIMVRITTTTTCRVEFGDSPAGSGNTILVYSGMHNDFSVEALTKVIAVAA